MTKNKKGRSQVIKSLDQDKEFKSKLKNIIDTSPLKKVIGLLENEIESQLTITSFSYGIPGFLKDTAYHFNEAVKEVLGFSTIKATAGASGDTPPKFLTVDFPDGNIVKVPFGDINLPGLSEGSRANIGYDRASRSLIIDVETERRHAAKIDEIVRKAKHAVKYHSIYANSALIFDEDVHEPQFADVSKFEDQPVFLNPEVEQAIIPIKVRLEKTEILESKGIDIKFGALLQGPYGTGKTLLAWNLAAKAVKNGWTFVYVKNPEIVKEVMEITQSLSHSAKGTLMFVEDIDLILSGDRDAEMNEVINLMDGGDNKKLNTIYLFTTNHIEKINPTFLRGKRIGALISMEHLEPEVTEKFIRYFLGENLDLNEDLTEVVKMISDNKITPAFVSEIIEKAQANLIFYEKDKVDKDTLKMYVKSYLSQIKLVQTTKEEPAEVTFVKSWKKLMTTTGEIIDRVEEAETEIINKLY